MYDALLVCGVKRVTDLPGDINYACERQWTFFTYHVLQCLATQKLHHEKDVTSLVFAEVSNT